MPTSQFSAPPGDGFYPIDETLWQIVEAIVPYEGHGNRVVRRWVRRAHGYRELAVPGWKVQRQEFFAQVPSQHVPYGGRSKDEVAAHQRINDAVTWRDEATTPVADESLVLGLIARSKDRLPDLVTSLPDNGRVVWEEKAEELDELFWDQHDLFKDLERLVRRAVKAGTLNIVRGMATVDPDCSEYPDLLKQSQVLSEDLVEVVRAHPRVKKLKFVFGPGNLPDYQRVGAEEECHAAESSGARNITEWPPLLQTKRLARALHGSCGRDAKAWGRYFDTPPRSIAPAREPQGKGRPALWNPIILVDLLRTRTARRTEGEQFTDRDARRLFSPTNQFMPDEWRRLWKERQEDALERFGT